MLIQKAELYYKNGHMDRDSRGEICNTIYTS